MAAGANSKMSFEDIFEVFDKMNADEARRMEEVLGRLGYTKRSSSNSSYEYRHYADEIAEIEESELSRKQKKLELEKKIREIDNDILDLKQRLLETSDEQEKADIRAEIRQKQRLKNDAEDARYAETRLGKAEEYNEKLGRIGNTINNIYGTITRMNDPWAKADEAAAKYGRTIAAVGKGIDALRKNTLNNMVNNKLGINYNISTEELLALQENYAKAVGRNIRLSAADQENLAAVNFATNGNATELLADFEKFGLSLSSSSDHIGKMVSAAAKEGVSLERYTKNVQQGLAMAQTYTFRGGLKGMEEMAKRAAAIRMDMSQVSSFAESFSTIEKAITNSAKLQVLGGPFAAGADALGLLNDSLNGIEDVEKRMEKFTEGMAHFNRATGEVEVSQFNKMRLRAYAEATGQDYAKVMETVNRQGAVREIRAQIATSANAAGLDEDMKRLIENAGTFKEGRAGVTINGEWKSIDELTNEDREALIAETRTQSEDIKEIAKDVRSLVDIRSGARKQKDAVQAVMTAPLAKLEKSLTNAIGHSNILLGIIAAVSLASSIVNVGGSLFGRRGVVGQTKGLFNKKGGARGGFRNTFSGEAMLGGTGKNAVRGAKLRGGKTIVSTAGKEYTQVGTRVFNASGKEIFGGAKTAVTKGATSVGKASITRRGAGRVAERSAIKLFGKSGAKLAGGIAKGGGIGIVGAIGNIAADALVDSGKMQKGGFAHGAMKTASSALEGAGLGMAIGSVVPGIGTAVGAIVGAIGGATIGIIKTAKAKNEVIVDNQLQSLGIERQGKYGAGKLKEIDKALQTGEMSNSLRRKLIKKGDTDIVNQINSVKETKKAEREEKRKERREKLEKALGIDKKIDTANFEIGVAHFGGRGILNKPILPGVSILRGRKEDGSSKELTLFKRLAEKRAERGETRRQERPVSSEPMEVNINGTIKLDCQGQKIDIMKEIKSNPKLLNDLTEAIIKSMNTRSHGAYVENRMNGDNRP